MEKPSVENVKAVSSRLFGTLLFLLGLLAALYVFFHVTQQLMVMPVVLIFGGIGAFVSLQRRLKQLSNDDLLLIRSSLAYTCLAPLTGAILAGILYLLFISGLVAGHLFPNFPPKDAAGTSGLMMLFEVSSNEPATYAKLLFWSFVAGFSESLVTDIIGRFDSQARERGAGE